MEMIDPVARELMGAEKSAGFFGGTT